MKIIYSTFSIGCYSLIYMKCARKTLQVANWNKETFLYIWKYKCTYVPFNQGKKIFWVNCKKWPGGWGRGGVKIIKVKKQKGLKYFCAISTMTEDIGLYGLIRRTALFSRLLRQARDTEDLFWPGSPRDKKINNKQEDHGLHRSPKKTVSSNQLTHLCKAIRLYHII